ncbi:hypothetical protein CK503_09735 [Aliifodinibius salipaludis]|uniref:Uncharacterized protein n=1 Tax=Fodinibius salipaludis TaxID=2032627 RepID=A0A2A2G8K4_9BACT|nr:hypothetical protein [Aliifodinibius salipaludis]PAU93941.1 hypothetical protein CK503_09735 [Aliifodinibius salipaludis]
MKNSFPIALILLLAFSIWSCEQPKSPDFQVNNQFEVPLTMEKTYPFLGADEALIDTTSEDFENIFDTDEDGLVSVVKEQSFNFGDLNNAIPVVNVPSIEVVNLTVPPTAGSHTVTANGSSSIDNSAFEFWDANHFVGMNGGELTVGITNDTDVSIDLEVTFPEVQDPNGSSLAITIDNILPGESISNAVSLADHRIYAGTDNAIDFEITVSTNSSSAQGGDISTEIGFESLGISRAEGYIVPKNVLLNADATGDGELDIFNDNEAEITNIDGISEISDHISNIAFSNPILGTLYNSNLGVNTTIYAVIAGTKSNGEPVYLKGNENSDKQVTSSEIPDALTVNGEPATADQVIKFSLDAVEDPSPSEGEEGSNEFNANNANTPAFFSNLPTSIRFVGVARINEQQVEGTIVNPVIFDPSLGVEIPFNFSADNATYQDTVDADLSDLPEEDEDRKLSEAAITINYTNGLPLDLTLNVRMLDANGNEITSKNDIAVNGASTDEDGFASDGAQSEHEISFSESEMSDLHRTRFMVLDITINTPQQESVSIRENDAVSFKVRVRAGITSTIN